jgi:hypothetical protein
MHPDTLVHASLAEISRLFQRLPPATPEARRGFYRARFIGPWWLRHSAGPSVALSGLPGWQGKRFLDVHNAINVVRTRQGLAEKLPMHCIEGPSLVDGKHGVTLHYPCHGPLPWRWIRDELRQLNEHSLLGMTVIDLPLLRRLAFPFVLQRDA